MGAWYKLDFDIVAAQLGTDPEKGLSTSEAARRLIENGPNELVQAGSRSAWAIAWEQVSATMVVILIVAAVVLAAQGSTPSVSAVGPSVTSANDVGVTSE